MEVLKKTTFALVISALLLSLLFPSCLDRIELEARGDDPLVVEAWITQDSAVWVKLTKTVAKTAPSEFPPVLDAEVVLRDDMGRVEVPAHAGDGEYRGELPGQPGISYTLEVKTGERQISGTSTMPEPLIHLDSVRHRYLADTNGVVKSSLLTLFFQDPPGKPTYLMVSLTVDEAPWRTFFLTEDGTADGQYRLFEIDLLDALPQGVRVKVDLLHIEAAVYNFLEQMLFQAGSDLIGGLTVAPPSNPPTNLQGKALGFFGAATRDSKTLVVQ